MPSGTLRPPLLHEISDQGSLAAPGSLRDNPVLTLAPGFARPTEVKLTMPTLLFRKRP